MLGIWSDGQEILAAHGVLNAATQVPVTTDSLFQVGSITKLWTATMIMQLVDEGLLSQDTTVSEVLPGVRLGAADVGGQVTVRHLLTHTSGIDGDIFTDTGRGDDCVERYVGLLAEVPSMFTPGATYSYCNSGFVLLGRIIEVIDGQSWDESLRERLTGPLAAHPDRHPAGGGDPAPGRRRASARGHSGHVWGLPRSVGPAGLITATPSDLLTFARLHLDGGITADGKRLLSEASVTAMRSAAGSDPRVRRARLGHRAGLATEPLGQPDDRRARRRHHRPVRLPADRPGGRVAACLLTNSGESESLYREVFSEVFGDLTGVTMPRRRGLPGRGPRRARGPGAVRRPLRAHVPAVRRIGPRRAAADGADHDGEPGRPHRRRTGGPVAVSGRTPRLFGHQFVLRSGDDEPWAPVSFDQLADGTPYLYMSGRVAPRVG